MSISRQSANMLFGTQFLNEVYADDTVTTNAHIKAIEQYYTPLISKESEKKSATKHQDESKSAGNL